MATRRQFNKVVITGCPSIPRGTNTQGGTVIGDYLQDGNRYIVVEMPKVEKKAGAKKAVKKQKYIATPESPAPQEVTHGA